VYEYNGPVQMDGPVLVCGERCCDRRSPKLGRCSQGPQLKPLGPHPADRLNDSLNAVSTFTAEKPRATLSDPQLGHRGLNPSVYAAIEARTSKGFSQSLQEYSYVGTFEVPVYRVSTTIIAL
jgi:hypothetical protein